MAEDKKPLLKKEGKKPKYSSTSAADELEKKNVPPFHPLKNPFPTNLKKPKHQHRSLEDFNKANPYHIETYLDNNTPQRVPRNKAKRELWSEEGRWFIAAKIYNNIFAPFLDYLGVGSENWIRKWLIFALCTEIGFMLYNAIESMDAASTYFVDDHPKAEFFETDLYSQLVWWGWVIVGPVLFTVLTNFWGDFRKSVSVNTAKELSNKSDTFEGESARILYKVDNEKNRAQLRKEYGPKTISFVKVTAPIVNLVAIPGYFFLADAQGLGPVLFLDGLIKEYGPSSLVGNSILRIAYGIFIAIIGIADTYYYKILTSDNIVTHLYAYVKKLQRALSNFKKEFSCSSIPKALAKTPYALFLLVITAFSPIIRAGITAFNAALLYNLFISPKPGHTGKIVRAVISILIGGGSTFITAELSRTLDWVNSFYPELPDVSEELMLELMLQTAAVKDIPNQTWSEIVDKPDENRENLINNMADADFPGLTKQAADKIIETLKDPLKSKLFTRLLHELKTNTALNITSTVEVSDEAANKTPLNALTAELKTKNKLDKEATQESPNSEGDSKAAYKAKTGISTALAKVVEEENVVQKTRPSFTTQTLFIDVPTWFATGVSGYFISTLFLDDPITEAIFTGIIAAWSGACFYVANKRQAQVKKVGEMLDSQKPESLEYFKPKKEEDTSGLLNGGLQKDLIELEDKEEVTKKEKEETEKDDEEEEENGEETKQQTEEERINSFVETLKSTQLEEETTINQIAAPLLSDPKDTPEIVLKALNTFSQTIKEGESSTTEGQGLSKAQVETIKLEIINIQRNSKIDALVGTLKTIKPAEQGEEKFISQVEKALLEQAEEHLTQLKVLNQYLTTKNKVEETHQMALAALGKYSKLETGLNEHINKGLASRIEHKIKIDALINILKTKVPEKDENGKAINNIRKYVSNNMIGKFLREAETAEMALEAVDTYLLEPKEGDNSNEKKLNSDNVNTLLGLLADERRHPALTVISYILAAGNAIGTRSFFLVLFFQDVIDTGLGDLLPLEQVLGLFAAPMALNAFTTMYFYGPKFVKNLLHQRVMKDLWDHMKTIDVKGNKPGDYRKMLVESLPDHPSWADNKEISNQHLASFFWQRWNESHKPETNPVPRTGIISKTIAWF